MADVLPWFPMYVLDWLNSPRVLALMPAERDAYFTLLCLQWRDDSLPFDCIHLWPLLPVNVERNAASRMLAEFFPPDPDTNRRRNPKMASLRLAAIAQGEFNRERGRLAAEVRWAEKRIVKALPEHPSSNTESQSESHPTPTPVLPVQVETALTAYLAAPESRVSSVPGCRAYVAALLHPERSPHYPPEIVARALIQMAGDGRRYKSSALESWCANLAREAQEGPPSPRGRTNGGRVGSGGLNYLNDVVEPPE